MSKKGIPQEFLKSIWFKIVPIEVEGKTKYRWEQYSKVDSLQAMSVPYYSIEKCRDSLNNFIERIQLKQFMIR